MSTRRAVLGRLGAAIGAVLAGSVAGCGGEDGDRRTPYDVPTRTPTAGVSGAGPGVKFDEVAPPDPGPARYRRWLPAPGALPERSVGRTLTPESDAVPEGAYDVRYVDFERLGDRRPPEGFRRHRRIARLGRDYFGLAVERTRRVVRMGGDRAVVVAGEVNQSAVADRLAGYRSVGRHRGYPVFARADDPRAVAVGPGAVVFSDAGPPGGDRSGAGETGDGPTGGVEAPLRAVRAVVDAAEGVAPRYAEAVGSFDRFSGAVGGTATGRLLTRRPTAPGPVRGARLEGVVGTATTTLFDRTRTYRRLVLQFDRPRPPDRVRLRLRRAALSWDVLRAATAVDVGVSGDGRSATVVGAVPDDRYARAVGRGEGDPDDGDADNGSADDGNPAGDSGADGDGRSVTYPRVTWGFDGRVVDGSGDGPSDGSVDGAGEDADGGEGDGYRVTVTHQAGDPVAVDRLTLSPAAADRALSAFATDRTAVTAGDSLSFVRDGPGRVRIVWRSPDGASSLLASYAVG